MNWLVFTLAAYLAYALDTGTRTLLQWHGVAPSFLLILAAYVGMLAPRSTVVWAYLVLGVLTDLVGPYTSGVTIIGPAALGYLVGSAAILQLRSLVFRESVLSLSVLTFAVGLFIHLTMLAILKLRGLSFLTGEPMALSAANALVQAFLHLLYSAVMAAPIGYLLLRTTALWSFPGKIRMDRYH